MEFKILLFGCLAILGSLDAAEIQPRINKGTEADSAQFPHHVSIVTKLIGDGSNRCNGALIATDSVLTSAYCMTGSISAIIGLGVNDYDSPMLSMKSEKFIIHPEYNPRTFENNLAIIKLPLNVGDFIKAIRLPSLSQASYNFVDHIGTVTGYATESHSDGPSSSNILQFAKVKIVELQQCQKIYTATVANNKTLCTLGFDVNDQGPCPNDHGSPLIVSELRADTLVGIVSYISNQGCFSGHPAGFVRIGAYLVWISEQTGIYLRP